MREAGLQPEVVAAGFLLFLPQTLFLVLLTNRTAFVGRFRFTQVHFWKRGEMKAKTAVECSIFHQHGSLWQFVRSLVAGCVASDWLNLHKVELWLWLCKFWHGAQLVRLPRRTHRALRGSISFCIDRFVWLCHGRLWHNWENSPAAYFTLLCRWLIGQSFERTKWPISSSSVRSEVEVGTGFLPDSGLITARESERRLQVQTLFSKSCFALIVLYLICFKNKFPGFVVAVCNPLRVEGTLQPSQHAVHTGFL